MKYILNDVETIGLNPPPVGSGVVQIAWMELDKNANTLSQHNKLVNPESEIDPRASAVHGLYAKDVADAPMLRDVYKVEGAAYSINHNSRFDIKWTAECYENLVGTICTLELSRLVWPKAPNHKLEGLVKYLGLPDYKAHDAFGDITATLNLLKVLMEKTEKNLEELGKFCAKPKVVYKMPFGMYKDRAIVSLPIEYIRYFDDKEIDHNLRKAFDQQISLRG